MWGMCMCVCDPEHQRPKSGEIHELLRKLTKHLMMAWTLSMQPNNEVSMRRSRFPGSDLSNQKPLNPLNQWQRWTSNTIECINLSQKRIDKTQVPHNDPSTHKQILTESAATFQRKENSGVIHEYLHFIGETYTFRERTRSVFSRFLRETWFYHLLYTIYGL